MVLAEGNHALKKAEYVGMLIPSIPAHPDTGVGHVVRVVLAVLGLQNFVAHAEHRPAIAQEEQGAKILALSFWKLDYFRSDGNFAIVGVAARAAVPAVR